MTDTTTNGFVQTDIQDKIAIITFFHPASNSFPSALLADLVQHINEVSNSEEVSVVILQSQGDGAFCAGASFDELLSIQNKKDGEQFFAGFANVINAMRTCKKIIITRVHGKAVGGGVGIISASDYSFATQNSSIKLSELAIGIGPFVIEPAVSRKIGKMATAEITLEATNWKTADWAKQNGLYNQVFETTSQMDETLQKFTHQLASYNPQALAEMKIVFWENTNHWNELLYQRAAISGELVLSDFTKNSLNQFKK
jgi:methylglutaconyl-CoA hydratase